MGLKSKKQTQAKPSTREHCGVKFPSKRKLKKHDCKKKTGQRATNKAKAASKPKNNKKPGKKATGKKKAQPKSKKQTQAKPSTCEHCGVKFPSKRKLKKHDCKKKAGQRATNKAKAASKPM